MEKIQKEDDLARILWEICDVLRGVMDVGGIRNYFFCILTIKFASESKQVSYFQIPDGCSFQDLYDKKDREDLGDALNRSLIRIQEANIERYGKLFSYIDFNSDSVFGKLKDRNTRLKQLLESFDDPRLDFRASFLSDGEVLGKACDLLLAKFAASAGKAGGEFCSPVEVSILVAKLVKPEAGDKIYDPACGSGSLLILCANEAMRESGKLQGVDVELYGQEMMINAWALAEMNMILHGLDKSFVENGDTIRSPLHLDGDRLMQFDVVVSNPPFGLRRWGDEVAKSDAFGRFDYGIPPKTSGDLAFVQHTISSMNEMGVGAIILPLGCLFRGASEKEIRKGLLDDNLIDAVIGLPGNLFFGTGIPACVLMLKKNRKSKDILFIDASNEYENLRNQNRLRPQDIDKITNTYDTRSEIHKYSSLVSKEEIAVNDYNMNISRYVDTFEEEQIDLETVRSEVGEIEKKLVAVQGRLSALINEIKY